MGWAPVVKVGLLRPLETDQAVARAFLSSLLLWWSMSSISRSFCKGQQGKLGIRAGTLGANTGEARAGLRKPQPQLALHFYSDPIFSWPRPLPPPAAAPTWEISVRMIPRYCLARPRASISARNSFLSWISLTTGQREGSSSHWAMGPSGSWWGGGRGEGLPLGGGSSSVVRHCVSLVHPQGSTLPRFWAPHTPSPALTGPSRGLRSSNRSSSGAGSFRCTARGFFFRSSLSFPVAKMFWSLRFSFSRSPVRPRKGLVKARRAPRFMAGVPNWACLLQGAWVTGRGCCNPGTASHAPLSLL